MCDDTNSDTVNQLRLLWHGGDDKREIAGVGRKQRTVPELTAEPVKPSRVNARSLPSVCAHCGGPLAALRPTKRFCSVRCRVAVHRALSREAMAKQTIATAKPSQTTA